jgi:hypothetical protein
MGKVGESNGERPDRLLTQDGDTGAVPNVPMAPNAQLLDVGEFEADSWSPAGR